MCSSLKKNKYIGENPLPKSERPKIGNSKTANRIKLYEQALKLTLEYVEGGSGLDREVFKNYIETVLEVHGTEEIG